MAIRHPQLMLATPQMMMVKQSHVPCLSRANRVVHPLLQEVTEGLLGPYGRRVALAVAGAVSEALYSAARDELSSAQLSVRTWLVYNRTGL